ncbi:MAG: hypothetical protein Q9168_006844 [Polycauliona sp. 1 TL-2023]
MSSSAFTSSTRLVPLPTKQPYPGSVYLSLSSNPSSGAASPSSDFNPFTISYSLLNSPSGSNKSFLPTSAPNPGNGTSTNSSDPRAKVNQAHAQVPATGFEDPPPSASANPPSAVLITLATPQLPKATPAKTIPEPAPAPTDRPPQQGSPAEPNPVPENQPFDDPRDSEKVHPSDTPVASPVEKDPASSPGAPVPVPQQPSPSPPPGKSKGGVVRIPSSDVETGDSTLNNNRPAPPTNLSDISSALFPELSLSPNQEQKQPDNEGQNQPSQQSEPQSPNEDFGGFNEQSQQAPPVNGEYDSEDRSSRDSSRQSPDTKSDPSRQLAKVGDHPPEKEGDVPTLYQPESSDVYESQGPREQQQEPPLNPNSQNAALDKIPGPNNAAPANPLNPNPSTFAFISSTPPPLAGHPSISRAPNGATVVGDTTIQPGEAEVIQGTPISLAPNAIIIGTSSYTFLSPPAPTPQTPPSVPSIEQGPEGGLIVGTTTIMPGNSGSINGHNVSVGSSNVLIDGKPLAFPARTAATSMPLIINGATIQKASNGNIIIGSSTLSPGSAATIDGHTISLATNDANIIIDQKTYTLPQSGGTVQIPLPSFVIPTSTKSVFTVGDQTFTANPTGFAVAGTSISLDGPAVTISGTIISLGSEGLVVGSTTLPLPSASSLMAEATGHGDVVTSAPGTPGWERGVGTFMPAPTGGNTNVTSFNLDSGAVRERGLHRLSFMMGFSILVGFMQIM